MNRKPFQGVWNIVRFNWHFYVLFLTATILALFLYPQLPPTIQPLLVIGVLLAFFVTVLSLLISYYIYDRSNLYQLNWLNDLTTSKILNINAGFDEISETIKYKFPDIDLVVCDFYDATDHTEISIERARKAYPAKQEVIQVESASLPFEADEFDTIIVFLAAHEIRDEAKRIRFFKELKRVTKTDGKIVVTEHLRDLNNFMAYTIGFLHFYSKKSWFTIFQQANLMVDQEISTTPFITTFILKTNGSTP